MKILLQPWDIHSSRETETPLIPKMKKVQSHLHTTELLHSTAIVELVGCIHLGKHRLYKEGTRKGYNKIEVAL